MRRSRQTLGSLFNALPHQMHCAMERNKTMIRLIWAVSVHTRYFLRRYMPTNILLDAIRTRRGLKWGIPAMLLAIPYVLIANVCVQLIEHDAPGWLHLIVLWAIWNTLKMLWIGPVSAVLLIRACIRESFTARRQRASLPSEADDAEERVVVDAIGVR